MNQPGMLALGSEVRSLIPWLRGGFCRRNGSLPQRRLPPSRRQL
jgi:hypothetical protein